MKTLKQLTVLILFLSGLMTTGCDRQENAPPPEPPTINVTDKSGNGRSLSQYEAGRMGRSVQLGSD